MIRTPASMRRLHGGMGWAKWQAQGEHRLRGAGRGDGDRDGDEGSRGDDLSLGILGAQAGLPAGLPGEGEA